MTLLLNIVFFWLNIDLDFAIYFCSLATSYKISIAINEKNFFSLIKKHYML